MNKKGRNIIITAFLVVVGLGLVVPSGAAITENAEILTSTYTRTDVDKVTISVTANFTLNNNYSSVVLYFILWPTDSEVGTSIATYSTTYSNYVNATNGTNGEVQQSVSITAYDLNAQRVSVYGADYVYLRMYVYNASIGSSNLLVKSSVDTDYWPTGGRYTEGTTAATTAEEGGTSYSAYLLLGLGALGATVVVLFIAKWAGLISFQVQAPRDEIVYRDGRKAWAERDSQGRFVDIVDPGRSMAQDRRMTSKDERARRRQ